MGGLKPTFNRRDLMSKLQDILEQAKAGLKPWEALPEARWPPIAAACGQAEFQDIEGRIQNLKNGFV